MKPPKHVVTRLQVLEAERSAYVDQTGAIVRSSRFEPSSTPVWPTGTWMVDDDGEIFILRSVRLSELEPSEFDWRHFREPGHWPRIRDAERYAEWMEQGLVPPPIRVVETWRGNLRVVDGHRRLAAHALLSRKRIRAWVSPLGPSKSAGLTWSEATGTPWKGAQR